MKYKLYSYTKKTSCKMVLISFGIISNKLFSIPVNALLVQDKYLLISFKGKRGFHA